MLDEVEKTLTNTAPTTYEIRNMTANGVIGLSNASSISSQFSSIINPIRHTNDEIVIFPSTMKIFPIPDTRENFAECLSIKVNAAKAEGQKFSLVNAI